jgi:hypothetical protein
MRTESCGRESNHSAATRETTAIRKNGLARAGARKARIRTGRRRASVVGINLTQQSIGVLVSTALPRALGIAKVDLDVCVDLRSRMIAERFAAGDYDQLDHFIADGVWDAAPLESELLIQDNRLVGGDDAVVVIDDTAMPKKGERSVGVAAQYASSLGKTANCQTLVSLTLARGEVPVMLALRLFLPENWTSDTARLKRAGSH